MMSDIVGLKNLGQDYIRNFECVSILYEVKYLYFLRYTSEGRSNFANQ